MGAEKYGDTYIPEYYDPELDNQHTKVDAVQQASAPGREVLIHQSAEQLNNLETQLTGASLKEIGVTRSTAFNQAKEVLNISEPLNFEEFENAIKEYQKAHGLEADGKIGKSTYMEMYNQNLIPVIDVYLKLEDARKKLDEAVMKRVEFAVSNPYSSPSTNIVLMEKVASLRNVSGDKAVNTRIDKSVSNGSVAINQDKSVQKALTTKGDSGKTFVEDLIDVAEGKQGAKDALGKHSGEIKLVSIVAFIFGAFSDVPGLKDLPGAGSWYGRIAWLFGGAYLGADKGFDYLFDKGLGAASAVKNGVQEGVKDYQTPEFIKTFKTPEWISNFGSNFGDKTGDLSKKVKETYDSALSKIVSINVANKENDKYVSDIKSVSEVVNSDPKLMNSDVTTLEKVKGDLPGIKSLLTNESSLFPATLQGKEKEQREKDLVNYVNLLLSQKDPLEDVYVKDLFYSKGVIDEFNEALSKLNVGYTKNTKADNEVKAILGTISDKKAKTDLIRIMSNELTIEDGNSADSKTKLEEYLKTNKILTSEDRQKIEQINTIFDSEIVLEDSIKVVNGIHLENPSVSVDTIPTIDEKVAKLEKAKTDFYSNTKRLSNYDNSEFDNAYNAKKLELVKEGVKLEGNDGLKYTDQLAVLENIVKSSQDDELIKSIEDSIKEVPTDKNLPKDFSSFIESNFDNFSKAEKLLSDKYSGTITPGSVEEKFKNRLETIVDKYKTVKENYERVKLDYIGKISSIKQKVDSIIIPSTVDRTFIENNRILLQGQLKEFEKIRSEVIEGSNYIEDAKILWNQYINGEVTIKGPENVFEKVDLKIGSATDKPELESTISLIKSKEIDIESKFSVARDVSNLEIKNDSDVSSMAGLIFSDKAVVDSFSDVIKKQKQTELKTIVSSITEKYVSAINNESDLNNLAQITSKYDTLVKEKVGDLMDDKEAVDKVYSKRIEGIKRDEFLNESMSTNSKIEGLLKDSGVMDFFAKYGIKDTRDDYYNSEFSETPKIIDITTLWGSIDNGTKLREVLENFRSTIPSLVSNNEEAKKEAQKVYNNLNTQIDIVFKKDLETYLKTIPGYLNKIIN